MEGKAKKLSKSNWCDMAKVINSPKAVNLLWGIPDDVNFDSWTRPHLCYPYVTTRLRRKGKQHKMPVVKGKKLMTRRDVGSSRPASLMFLCVGCCWWVGAFTLPDLPPPHLPSTKKPTLQHQIITITKSDQSIVCLCPHTPNNVSPMWATPHCSILPRRQWEGGGCPLTLSQTQKLT